jgi:hypothetical protein
LHIEVPGSSPGICSAMALDAFLPRLLDAATAQQHADLPLQIAGSGRLHIDLGVVCLEAAHAC